MLRYKERKCLFYKTENVFDIVADIESYSEFLPWCIDSSITNRRSNILYAELVIGFQSFKEKYTSKVVLRRPHRIDIEYVSGPFKDLITYWSFEKQNKLTVVDFFIEFEFKSLVLQRIMGILFKKSAERMISAFEKRTKQIYGN